MSQITLRELKLNSAVKYVAREGFVNNFPITFAYDNPTQLQVFVGFKRVGEWDLQVLNGLPSVVLPEDLKVGQGITIRRASPAEGVPHTYQYKGNAQGGAEFSAKTIDENFEYMSNLVAEVEDYNTIAQDNLSDMEEKFEVTQDIANEAIRVAGEAKDTADNAEQVALGIDGKAQEALDNSVEALGTANDAKTTALGIDGKAQEALDQSTNASQDASNALSIAQSIDGKAQSALDNSTEALGTANTALTVAQGIDGKAQDALDTAQSALDSIPTDYVKDSDFNALSTIVDNKRDLDNNTFNGLMTIKSDNDEQGVGILLQESDGTVRGQVVATDQGLQLTQYFEDGSLQTFTFPKSGEGGEVVVSEALYSKVTQIATVTELRNTEPLYIGQLVYVLEYHAGTGYGGGLYKAVENTYSGSDSEETVNGSRWRMVTDGNVFPIDRLGAIKDNEVSVKDAFIRAIECVREAGSGTVYVGAGEWTMASVTYEVNTSNITFHFDLGCHFKMENVLLGWYPIAAGRGYSNVSIVGEGTIEALPDTMWHNDLVYVTGIKLKDLTFIRPVLSGHFLDVMGCTDVCIENITVLGSNVERPDGTGRFFSEFIQVGDDYHGGLGWGAKRDEYEPLMNRGIGSTNVSLTNSSFLPHHDGAHTTYPPRPFGNHAYNEGTSNLRIEGNTFIDVISQDNGGRPGWVDLPNSDMVIISGNTFICTGVLANSSTIHSINIRGSEVAGSTIIRDNVFDIQVEDALYTSVVRVLGAGAKVVVANNTIKIVAMFSDAISLHSAITLKVVGNTIHSTGRRFVFGGSGSVGSTVTVSDNVLVFDTIDTSEHRHPIHLDNSKATITGNHIRHPSMAIRTEGEVPCVVTGNLLDGGADNLQLGNAVMAGNLFNMTKTPYVFIGGVKQTSQGWNFVHISPEVEDA